MNGSAGFYVVNTSGDLVTFIKGDVAPPFLGAGKYLFARIGNSRSNEVVIGKWNAKRRLVGTFHVGNVSQQLAVDRSGALWFWVGDQTLGRISTDGAYCELAIPPSAQYGSTVSGSVVAPDGYLYYARGAAVGKIKVPQ